MAARTNSAESTSFVLPSLVRWGVSADGDLVYRALATFGPQTSQRVARDLGMAPRRVADALDELASLGAIARIASGTQRRSAALQLWRAGAPEHVVHQLRRRQFRLVDPWEITRRHLASIEGLDLPTSAAEPAPDGVRLIRGLSTIRERVAELSGLERHEHLTMNPEQATSSASMAAGAPLDRALLMRGVRLTIISAPPADGDVVGAHPAELARLGGKFRFTDELPLKVLMFDRKVAILPLNLQNVDKGALEVQDPRLVQSLVSLIIRWWDTARDPARAGVSSLVLTARERALVELLAAGHTDSLVSRRLGISARTVGYTLRGLMDRLNVENRFQLGLALGAQGIYPATSAPDAAGGPLDG